MESAIQMLRQQKTKKKKTQAETSKHWLLILQVPGRIKTAAPSYSFGIRHTQYEAPLIVEVIE